jgi:non-heme chloroperoxidase
MTTPPRPVIFVHGWWLHASSWPPWLDLFAGAGYAPTAPGWPGNPTSVAETREHPELLAGHGR